MSNPFTGKTTQEIISSVRNQDEGFCNPIKAGLCIEERADAIEALEDRGYSFHEARQMVNSADDD